MIKLVIFDLDGTVCNTIDDLAASTNHALAVLGYPTHPVEAYKYFVGNGMSNLIYRALPEGHKSEEECSKAKKLMLGHYETHFADKSAPYEGIPDLLKTLKRDGIKIAVCTNKAHYMAVEIAQKIFGGIFDAVMGQGDEYPLKPDPTSTKMLMERFDSGPEETLFVGDSGVDMQTAHSCSLNSIGVLWGFRTEKELKENGASFIAEAPTDILTIIKNI